MELVHSKARIGIIPPGTNCSRFEVHEQHNLTITAKEIAFFMQFTNKFSILFYLFFNDQSLGDVLYWRQEKEEFKNWKDIGR